MKKYILASASPRRKELLEQIGLDFDIVVSNADEDIIKKDMNVSLYVQELALIKANAVAKTLYQRGEKNKLIISADTIVVSDGEILGKPKNEDDAFLMLSKLSGKEHEVYTGFSIMRTKDMFTVANYEKTIVKFFDLEPEKIREYIALGEPMDKAGAYAIQGLGAIFVEKIDGDYQNVVGLPVGKLVRVLEEEFGEKII